MSKQFLQSARFDFVKRPWKIAWLLPNAKGGCTEFTVHESGAIRVQYGE